jgi:hypothetical protein
VSTHTCIGQIWNPSGSFLKYCCLSCFARWAVSGAWWNF